MSDEIRRKYFQEVVEAFEALPHHELIADYFSDTVDGRRMFCAAGAVAKHRGWDGESFCYAQGQSPSFFLGREEERSLENDMIQANNEFEGTPEERWEHMHDYAKQRAV